MLYNPNVVNELIKSWEAGFEARLFDNRVTLDFSLYKSNATNQLLDIPMDRLSGRRARKLNAGNIENKGFELMLGLQPVRNDNFTWDIMANISKNINNIIDIAESEDVTQYQIGGFDAVSVMAINGQRYGAIYGNTFARVTDDKSPYFGRIIVDANGIPTQDAEKVLLGSQQPDALVGLTNTFTYKNLSFSFLIDARFGGVIFSGTNHGLKSSGRAEATVVNGERADIIYNGVVSNGSGGYTENTTAVSPQLFWEGVTTVSGTNLGIAEDNIFDATNIRIRNVQLNYNLPKGWINGIGAQHAKVGFSANNVLMLKSHLNGVDPESVFATGTNAVGFEMYSPPTTRTYFFNFSISF